MKMKTLKAILILAAALLLLYPVSSKADSFDFQLTVPNTALQPYPAPYADVHIDLTGGIATIKFTADNSYAFGDGSALALNVADGFTFVSVTAGFTQVTPPPAGPWNVDGFGKFNLVFDDGSGFSAPYFTATVVLSGSWANAASVLTDNSDDYFAAAHMGAPDPDNPGKYIATGYAANGVAVPEPGILILLGIAMSAIGVAVPFLRKI
jgi:hypothetical protein